MIKKLWWVLVGVIVVAVIWQSINGRTIMTSVMQKVSGEVAAPGFEGGGNWLNSELLTLDGLLADEKTQAVLVDFWTYSCINCQRTIPYLRTWWDKYQDRGLVIVGVHSPEFEFEKEMAINKYGVGWPVVQDNEMKIWQAYGNNYWPRKYLINREGKIVYDHIGEGGYEETEKEIQKLLDIELSSYQVTEEPFVADAPQGKLTPELYLNKRRQVSDQVKLTGEWVVTDDYALAGNGAKLKLEY